LLFDKNTADINLRIGEQSTIEIVRAHKAILCARSPVFYAMLQLRDDCMSMSEASSKEVDIPDVEPQVFKDMLKYMYTEDCR